MRFPDYFHRGGWAGQTELAGSLVPRGWGWGLSLSQTETPDVRGKLRRHYWTGRDGSDTHALTRRLQGGAGRGAAAAATHTGWQRFPYTCRMAPNFFIQSPARGHKSERRRERAPSNPPPRWRGVRVSLQCTWPAGPWRGRASGPHLSASCANAPPSPAGRAALCMCECGLSPKILAA